MGRKKKKMGEEEGREGERENHKVTCNILLKHLTYVEIATLGSDERVMRDEYV
jgi:uncharacterized membrane protein